MAQATRTASRRQRSDDSNFGANLGDYGDRDDNSEFDGPAGYPSNFEGDCAPVFKVVNGRKRCVWVEQSAWEVDAIMQAHRWARACSDFGDDFDRFLRLLKTDYCLDEWLAKTPRDKLRAIWATAPYRRPRTWQGTIVGVDGCALKRWRWLCSSLRCEDAIWHRIPNGEEAAYCVALDWLRWEGTGRKGDKPDPRVIGERAEQLRIVHAAADLRDRWKDWRGSPWRVVADARRVSFEAWEREWPRRRAGEGLTFKPPSALGGIRVASLSTLKLRRK
jgi:hypothetical protein